jgi:PAS domain S-box-containing protein
VNECVAPHPEELESARLRRSINDLVAIHALSTTWTGGEAAGIGRTLAEALMGMLDLDFIVIELASADGLPIEIVKAKPSAALGGLDSSFALRSHLDNEGWPDRSRTSLLGDDISLACFRLGLGQSFGRLSAAAFRDDFPNDPESLLLSIACNQAVLALQDAEIREQHRARTSELDRSVEERTRELADANKALQQEVAERRRVEDALRASELSATSLVEGIPGFVAVLAPDGDVQRVNQQILDYTGQSLEQLKSWGSNGTVHAEDLPHVAEIFGNSIAAGIPYSVEQRLRRFDGEYLWFGNRGRPIRDEAGRIVAWHVLLTDIDDRKRAEQALAASERNLQLTIDSMPALAWSAGPDGAANYFNQHYLDYVGRTLGEVQGWQWTGLICPEDLPGLAGAWERFRIEGTSGEVEARIRRHDGVFRWFLFRANPLRDESGNIIKWYGVNTDIEEQKSASAKLHEVLDHLNQAQRLTHTGSFRTDVDTDTHIQSEELFRILECRPPTIREFRERVHPDDVGSFDAGFKRAMAEQVDFDEVFRFVTPTGKVKYVHAVAHFLPGQREHPVVMGSIQDITESRLASDALAEARSELAHITRVASLNTLTASIAHEVNQPLAGILMNANTCLRMLAAEPPDLAGAADTARRTIRDADRASEVIKRLRGMFAKRGANLEDLDLNETAREVIGLSAAELARKQVNLRTCLADGLPLLRGDRIQLQQVMLNLILNAADATAEVTGRSKCVTVSTELDSDGHVRLAVIDNGAGFGSEKAEQLFSPFFSTKPEGMGMGLSISRSIVESHGGKLWAVANAGPGATFGFTIPPSDDVDRATAAEPASS